jgi:hypothetical protein
VALLPPIACGPAGSVREPAHVGDAATCALALSRRRDVHGHQHFGDLCIGVGHNLTGITLGAAEQAYLSRATEREA